MTVKMDSQLQDSPAPDCTGDPEKELLGFGFQASANEAKEDNQDSLGLFELFSLEELNFNSHVTPCQSETATDKSSLSCVDGEDLGLAKLFSLESNFTVVVTKENVEDEVSDLEEFDLFGDSSSDDSSDLLDETPCGLTVTKAPPHIYTCYKPQIAEQKTQCESGDVSANRTTLSYGPNDQEIKCDTDLPDPVTIGTKFLTGEIRSSEEDERLLSTSQPSSITMARQESEEFNHCVICMDTFTNPKILEKCSHKFCMECIDEHFKHKPVCPVCFVPYGVITGTQPEGYMSDRVIDRSLPGFTGHKTIIVSYGFCDGIQGPEHPNPGVAFSGTNRTGYLPDNSEGRKVLALLKVAFKRRLVFTVGRSRTTGCDNTVTWNDIHHKTCISGGQDNPYWATILSDFIVSQAPVSSFGYPDPTYLERVQQELAAFGVTEDSLKG